MQCGSSAGCEEYADYETIVPSGSEQVTEKGLLQRKAFYRERPFTEKGFSQRKAFYRERLFTEKGFVSSAKADHAQILYGSGEGVPLLPTNQPVF
jgi:hypothetical protein